jgi:peptidoglycan/xylan/chitin deacetylase (PgdA/CDA1 family)
MANGIAVLMYHELQSAGRPLCHADAGYQRYVVAATAFRVQLEQLKASGFSGVCIGDALKGLTGKHVGLTFDDGCESDLIFAAPALNELGFHATFYITAGFLGRSGYLTEPQLRELIAGGFEIGCHSMTHPYLNELDDTALHDEIAGAKEKLEQVVGRPVEHFSCPGGRFNQRVVAKVKEAGYATLANSEPSLYSRETDVYSIGRIPVLHNTEASELERICEGRGLWRRALGRKIRSSAQKVVGNRLYDGLRSSLLSRSE